MPLDAFHDGGRIFLDANIFLLHYWDQSPACSRLLERIETGLIHGVTSTTVLGEVAHRLLIAEAILQRPTISRHPVRYVKTHPAFVRSLTQTRTLLDQLTRLPLQVVALTPAMWHHGVVLMHELGLLMNDATTVACLRRLRLSHLASADHDFDHVPGLTRWSP